MTIRKPKIFAGTLILFLLIAGYHEYKDYKLKHEQKPRKMIEKSLEDIDIDSLFISSESPKKEIEIEKPEVKKGK